MHWRLSRLDVEGPHGWRRLDPAKFGYLVQQFNSWECLTDAELFNMPGNGPVPQDGLVKSARDRLVELEYDDLDELWHLRLSGRERIWGARSGNSFSLIWWDPAHEVAPAPKKHT